MRRGSAVLVSLLLLVSAVFVFGGNIKMADAINGEVYQGDLILGDNNVTIIENKVFHVNGSIIVRENATLILRNAWMNFTQNDDYQFNMTLKDDAHLILYNSNITTNNHAFYINFESRSTAEISGLITEAYIQLMHYSAADIQNSNLRAVYILNYANVSLSNCLLDLMDISGNTKCLLSGSAVSNPLSIGIRSANATIAHLKPGYISSWNFLTNCAVEKGSEGYAPDLTILDTTINMWCMYFYGSSNVFISHSTLENVGCYGSSKVSLYASKIDILMFINDEAFCSLLDTSVQMLYMYDSSEIWAFNATINVTPNIYDDAQLYIGWWLNIHVIDSIGNTVPDANITITDEKGHQVAYGKTNLEGLARFTLLENLINATGVYPRGNYIVEAIYGEHSNSQLVAMDGNQEITIQLSFIIPEFSTTMLLLAIVLVSAITIVKKGKML
ncbi:MAG: carboxypeptidase-like regulatory domain-containing protein [Candidatus Bathyarchaeia archaeon]